MSEYADIVVLHKPGERGVGNVLCELVMLSV